MRTPESSRERAPRAEHALALLVFALPLAYLATERSAQVFLFRWSKGWLLSLAAYTVFYAGISWSYRRAWPRGFVLARRFAVALCGSVVLVLAASETWLRAHDHPAFRPLPNSGRHKFDPDVGHVYLPSFSQVIQTREFSTQWRSNAQGLRAERDYGPKPAGVARVLVVGDSFTVGDQVPYPETYPGVMQAELDRLYSPGRVEVLNAGFPGFGTIHERKWIEKFAAAFEPDLIVVGSTPNDLLENKSPILYVARDGELASPTATDGDRLRAADHARWYSVPGWVERSLVLRELNARHFFERLRGHPESAHHAAFEVAQSDASRRQYALYEKEILLARDAAAARGAKFAVLAIPFLEQLGRPGANQDFTLWGKRLAEIGARNGFPVVDLLPAFLAGGDPALLYGREDSHCRAAGYRLIGAAASAALSALGSRIGLPELPERAR